MTKTWLMRRPVRRPVSRATTAPAARRCAGCLSSAASASPSRTSATAFAAAAWLCGASTIRALLRSMPCLAASACDVGGRADEDRRDQALLRRPRPPPASAECLARMRDRRRHRLEAAAPLQQRLVLAGPGLWLCQLRCVMVALRDSRRGLMRHAPRRRAGLEKQGTYPGHGAPRRGKLDFSGYCGVVPVERPARLRPRGNRPEFRARPPRPAALDGRGDAAPPGSGRVGNFLVAVLAVAADGRAVAWPCASRRGSGSSRSTSCARGCPGRCPRSPSSSGTRCGGRRPEGR